MGLEAASAIDAGVPPPPPSSPPSPSAGPSAPTLNMLVDGGATCVVVQNKNFVHNLRSTDVTIRVGGGVSRCYLTGDFWYAQKIKGHKQADCRKKMNEEKEKNENRQSPPSANVVNTVDAASSNVGCARCTHEQQSGRPEGAWQVQEQRAPTIIEHMWCSGPTH